MSHRGRGWRRPSTSDDRQDTAGGLAMYHGRLDRLLFCESEMRIFVRVLVQAGWWRRRLHREKRVSGMMCIMRKYREGRSGGSNRLSQRDNFFSTRLSPCHG
jgi:hypothetical protein